MNSNNLNLHDDSFKFSEKRGKLNWKALEELDIAKLQREVDINQLERLLQNVTFALLEKDPDMKRMRDKNLIKLFKLGQLTTEYVIYTQSIAEKMAEQRQREHETKYKEAIEL